MHNFIKIGVEEMANFNEIWHGYTLIFGDEYRQKVAFPRGSTHVYVIAVKRSLYSDNIHAEPRGKATFSSIDVPSSGSFGFTCY